SGAVNFPVPPLLPRAWSISASMPLAIARTSTDAVVPVHQRHSVLSERERRRPRARHHHLTVRHDHGDGGRLRDLRLEPRRERLRVRVLVPRWGTGELAGEEVTLLLGHLHDEFDPRLDALRAVFAAHRIAGSANVPGTSSGAVGAIVGGSGPTAPVGEGGGPPVCGNATPFAPSTCSGGTGVPVALMNPPSGVA